MPSSARGLERPCSTRASAGQRLSRWALGLIVAVCVAGCGARTGLLASSETASNGGSAGRDQGIGGVGATAGFGGTSPSGGGNIGTSGNGGTASGGTGFPTGGACGNACAIGQLECLAGGIAKCVTSSDGCTEWSAPTPCAVNQICQTNNGQPSCACAPNSVLVAGVCTPVGVPRPIAPLSTATVTSQQPVLHWALAPGDAGAQVEICSDRACTQMVTTFNAVGSSGTPPAALTRGVYFWRLHGSTGGVVSTAASAVWQFTVGARSALVNASSGTTLDVNGDGYADVIVGAHADSSIGGNAYLYLGGANGLTTLPVAISSPTVGNGFSGPIASAGDVNGDGFADVILAAVGPYNGPGGRVPVSRRSERARCPAMATDSGRSARRFRVERGQRGRRER